MHALLINSNMSEGPVYASFNLGQYLNVALLDLVAAVVSLLTSCNIQTSSNIQRGQMRLRKKCKLLFIKFYYFFDFLKASFLNLKKKTTELR